MTLVISHTFVSAKGDGTDATLVRPSNWNAAHTTSMANNQLLGNTSGGVGAIQEIPATPFMVAALNSPDAATFLATLGIGAFGTGDVKYSINPTASTGWIVYQGGLATIGDASSAASVRSNADCSNLFQLIWNQISSPSANVVCPVVGGLGASAAADFAAHKKITLPWYSGRGMVGAGAGSPLTTRTVGVVGGEETHQLVLSELASHVHSAAIYDQGHTHNFNDSHFGATATIQFWGSGWNSGAGVGGGGAFGPAENASIISAGTGVRVWDGATLDQTYANGGNGFHNNMQPYIPMWVHLKL